MAIQNKQLAAREFLADMARDKYYPPFLVAKGQRVLTELCERIEAETPADDAAVLALTHAATQRFNELEDEFGNNGSEIETVARETIAGDIFVILENYGFGHIDLEEAISNRDW